jgi:Asparaginase, N-terminal
VDALVVSPRFVPFKNHALSQRYLSGQLNASQNDDTPLQIGIGKTLIHVMLGGGGTINMKSNEYGTRSVVMGADPFIEQVTSLKLTPYQVLAQPVLPKPMDSSCHDVVSLHYMTRAIFEAYQTFLETLRPDTEMIDPFKLLFPHGTDTLTHVTGILHYMILQAGLNMTVVPVGAIEPSNSTTPDGPHNIKGAFQFLQTNNVPGAFTVCTNPETQEGEVLSGTNAFKLATSGTQWLQHIGGKLDGVTASEDCRFNATQSNLLKIGINPNIVEQKRRINEVIANLTRPNPVILRLTYEQSENNARVSGFARNLQNRIHLALTALNKTQLILVAQTQELPKATQETSNPLFRLPLQAGKSLHPITAWAKLIALQLLGIPNQHLKTVFYHLKPWEGVPVDQLLPLPQLPPNLEQYGVYVAVTPTLSVQELATAVGQLKRKQFFGNPQAKHLILGGVGNGHLPIGYDTFMERFVAYPHKDASLSSPIHKTHLKTPITSIAELENALTYRLGRTEARAYLQRCFAESHPVLGALHQYIQHQGIAVWVGTTVPNGVADQAYSVGEMLHYMGVQTLKESLPKGLKQFV